MDDQLELPNSVPGKKFDAYDEEQSSGDEEGGLDWTKIMPTAARPVIPKRGEKEFEPRASGGTSLQMHVLNRSRMAMFETLRATRTVSSKGISYGIWYPALGRTHVTIARGIHFSSMGHSAPREILDENGVRKVQKRLELLPEEAIYLIERGTLFCWKDCGVDTSQLQGFEGINGAPMSVQQAYVEMIGKDGLTLEKFQVYAYLRRLGYAVMRTEPPNDSYPVPPPFVLSNFAPKSLSSRLYQATVNILSIFTRLFRFFFARFNWWRPVLLKSSLHHDYPSLFRSLRFIPSGHSVPPPSNSPSLLLSSPYKIFYNIYKPSTPFKKTSPPQPDFQVVVVNAQTTPMPTLHELTALFDILPELPPPLPRPKRQAYGQKPTAASNVPTTQATMPTSAFQNIPMSTSSLPENSTSDPASVQASAQNSNTSSKPSLLHHLFPFFFARRPTPESSVIKGPHFQHKPNPFAALKQGKKIVVIAVVDNGNISFFKFGQGTFEEWPVV